MKILTMKAVPTGGNILTYFGELDNGQFYAYCEGAFAIYDADYGETFEHPEEDPYFWEKEHEIKRFDVAMFRQIEKLVDEIERR